MNNLSNQIQTVLEQSASPLILTWKSKKMKGALITKIGEQRYLGIVRKDKKGQEYWKYHLLTKLSESGAVPPPASKAKGGEVEHSPEVGESELSPDASSKEKVLEQVIKFREKYGIPNQSQKST